MNSTKTSFNSTMSDGDLTKSIFGRLFFDVLKEETTYSSSSTDVKPPIDNVDDLFEQHSNIQAGFEDMNISPELMKALYEEMKFVRPSKIQSMTLPMILSPPYKNLIAQAPMCSGKTTCFVLGMLSRVDPTLPAPQALCICPTRQLAVQTMEVLLKMGKFTGITSDLCLPADRAVADYIPASKRAPLTAQVIISSPGTIYQMIEANKLSISNLKILVFEEVDQMLCAFKEDALRIMKQIVRWSPECQVLLFSATFDDAVEAFVSTLVKDLFEQEFHQLFVKKEELSLDSVKQFKVNLLDELSKIMVIKDKIMELGDGIWQTIIFVRAIKSAEMLHEALVKYGHAVTTIKGPLTYKNQEKMIKDFKDGSTRILISADYLARGFDQSEVNLVVNYDLPVRSYDSTEPDYEAYLNRIGRAGRFGRKGAVFNLLCGDEDNLIMAKIERHFNHNVTEVPSWANNDDFNDAFKKAGLM